MQKALEQMNRKLTEVVSDITGKTGMEILRAILAGERDPQRLALHRDRRCKHDQATIAKALEGHWRAEHLFALQQALEQYDPRSRGLKAPSVFLCWGHFIPRGIEAQRITEQQVMGLHTIHLLDLLIIYS
jgi:hypothetical protein